MKRSNSQFRRFSHSKIPTVTYLILAVAGIFVAISSCKNRDDKAITDVPTPAQKQTALITIKDDITASWIPLKDTSDPKVGVVAWLGGKSCIESNLQIKTRISAGMYSVDILMEQAWNSNLVSAQVDGISMNIAGGVFTNDIKERLCEEIRADGDTIILPTAIAGAFKSAVELNLASISPDCRSIDVTSEGWSCSLSSLMPQSAIIVVEEFQQAMIRRWSRQPYVLARRAGVTMTLAKAATNLTNDVNIHKFCRLLQFSLPEELPLVMTSSRWQKSLCDGNEKYRREAAFHGLAKAVEELSMIRQLYESTSKVGMFSIKIPGADIPGQVLSGLQPLRITITPEQEVTDRLIEVAESVLGSPQPESRKGRITASLKPPIVPALEQRQPQCWHPMFSDSRALMRVADGMRLTGDGFKGECKIDGGPSEGPDPLAKYLMESLTSETEFVMDNGQTKLLRLPEGEYQYTVEVLPQNPVDAEDQIEEAIASSRGRLSWGTSRDHSIRIWQ